MSLVWVFSIAASSTLGLFFFLWRLSKYAARWALLRGRRQPGVKAARERSALQALTLLGWGGIFGTTVLTGISPFYGLVGAVCLPFGLLGALRLRRLRQMDAVERSALPFLFALRGFLKAGLSLHAALFRLCQSRPTPFSRLLSASLERFEGGRPLGECLARFRARTGLRRVSLLLSTLSLCHRNGLAVLPILERWLPVLEVEQAAQDRVRDLRRAVLGQMVLAALMPWLVVLCLWAFHPEMAIGFRESALFFPAVALALVWQGLGVGLLWKIARFD